MAFILTWSGHGYLVLVITAASCTLMDLTVRAMFHDDRYYNTHVWPIPVAFATAGVICYFVGRALDRNAARIRYDEIVVLPTRRDTFLFLRVWYWGPILLVIAVVDVIRRVLEVYHF
jgi:hypothetical protein